MSNKRPAESETPDDAQEPKPKRPSAADEGRETGTDRVQQFLSIVRWNIRKSDIGCCTGDEQRERICWAMWAEKYFETRDQRTRRGAPMPHDPLLTLCETFAGNLMLNHIGNFELQLTLHSLVYASLQRDPKPWAEGLDEIRSNSPHGRSDQERWFLIMNEVINRHLFRYTPLIEDVLTYHSGRPIGLHPSDW
jgi:hypothetical protein